MPLMSKKDNPRHSSKQADHLHRPVAVLPFSVWAVILIFAVEAFAVFANGAYFLGPMTLFAVCAWVLVLMFMLFNHRSALSSFTPGAVVAILVLTTFWLWTGATIKWSLSAQLTLNEFNRTGGYLALFGIGVACSRWRQARIAAAWLLLIISASAAIYALGAKALPGHVDNLDSLGRLAIPLGYANGMGLLMAMSFPLALYFSASQEIFWPLRCLAAATGPLLITAMFFTFSRGAALALAVGLVAYFCLVPGRLRSLGMLVILMAPASLEAWWSSGQPALTGDAVVLALRAQAAAPLRLYLLASVAATIAAMAAVTFFAGKIRFSQNIVKIMEPLAVLGVFSMAIAGLWLLADYQPVVREWTAETYGGLSKPVDIQSGTGRLLTINSPIRWQLWQEAAANWRKNPVGGSGAQSFPLIHLNTRSPGTPFVKQAHSLILGSLSELGTVGFALGSAFALLALALALLSTRKIRNRWDRGLAGVLTSITIMYLVHTSYDWDWNIFALTMVYFLFAGMLAGHQTNKRVKRRSS